MSPSESDPGCSVAWYDDRSRTEFVGRYANAKQFQRDLQMAAARGWFVVADDQATINAAGSPNDKVTVTFQRAADWLAAREREMEAARRAEATRAADDWEAALVMASEALARAEETFASLSGPSAATDELTALAAEQALLTACKDMVAKRRRVIRTLDEAVREMATAVALGVSEFAPSLSRYQAATRPSPLDWNRSSSSFPNRRPSSAPRGSGTAPAGGTRRHRRPSETQGRARGLRGRPCRAPCCPQQRTESASESPTPELAHHVGARNDHGPPLGTRRPGLGGHG